MKLDKYQKTVLMAMLFVAIAIPIMDYLIYPTAFFGWVYLVGALIAFIYYIFKEDLSEAIGIFLAYLIFTFGGLWDLMFFIYGRVFLGNPIPAEMPHLYDHWFMGNVAKILGFSNVTIISLIISTIISLIIAYYIIKWFRKIRRF